MGPFPAIREYFDGISITPVILATAHGEGRLQATGPNVISGDSGGSAESADEFQKRTYFIKCAYILAQEVGLVRFFPIPNGLSLERKARF